MLGDKIAGVSHCLHWSTPAHHLDVHVQAWSSFADPFSVVSDLPSRQDLIAAWDSILMKSHQTVKGFREFHRVFPQAIRKVSYFVFIDLPFPAKSGCQLRQRAGLYPLNKVCQGI